MSESSPCVGDDSNTPPSLAGSEWFLLRDWTWKGSLLKNGGGTRAEGEEVIGEYEVWTAKGGGSPSRSDRCDKGRVMEL